MIIPMMTIFVTLVLFIKTVPAGVMLYSWRLALRRRNHYCRARTSPRQDMLEVGEADSKWLGVRTFEVAGGRSRTRLTLKAASDLWPLQFCWVDQSGCGHRRSQATLRRIQHAPACHG